MKNADWEKALVSAVLKFQSWKNVSHSMTVLSCLSYHQATMNLVQFAANGHIDTYARAHTCIAVTHCGSRLVQLLLGSDINTEQIGGDLQPLLFDLSSSCHISWHCPPATPRGAGRTGMASTCLPGLFSVFFPFQLIPLCPLHGFSSANYKSSPTPSDSPDSRDLQSTSLSSSERSDATSACDVSLACFFTW